MHGCNSCSLGIAPKRFYLKGDLAPPLTVSTIQYNTVLIGSWHPRSKAKYRSGPSVPHVAIRSTGLWKALGCETARSNDLPLLSSAIGASLALQAQLTCRYRHIRVNPRRQHVHNRCLSLHRIPWTRSTGHPVSIYVSLSSVYLADQGA